MTDTTPETGTEQATPVYYLVDSPDFVEADLPHKGSVFVALLAVFFIVGAMTLSRRPGWNYAVKGMGALLVLSLAIRSIRFRLRMAPESMLFLMWVVWSTTGLLASPNLSLFWQSYWTIAQMALLLFVVSCVAQSRTVVGINIMGLFLGAAIVGLYSVYTGEYQRAEITGERVEGLVKGANGFAWYMLLASVCLAYFWMRISKRAMVRKILILVGMFLLLIAIVLSGSRKGLLGLVLFYVLWLWYCYRKHVFRNLSVFAGVLIALIIGGVVTVSVTSNTRMAERLSRTWEAITPGGKSEGAGEERIMLMKNAWVAFLDSPVVGIGLDNVRLRNPGYMHSHCEYTEILSNTGLLGFMLYFGIYFVLWRRSVKLAKCAKDPSVVDLANLVRAFMLTVIVLSLGRWNYNDKALWALLGTFIGYTSVLWRHVKECRDASPYYVQASSLAEEPQPCV